MYGISLSVGTNSIAYMAGATSSAYPSGLVSRAAVNKQLPQTTASTAIQYTSGAEKTTPAVNGTRTTDGRLVAYAVVGFKYSATLRINGDIFGGLYLEAVARSINRNRLRTDTVTSVPYFVHQRQLGCKHQTSGLFPHWY